MTSSPNALVFATALGLFVSASVSADQQATHQTPARSESSQQAADNIRAAALGVPTFAELDIQNRGYITRSGIPKNVEGLKDLRSHFAQADLDQSGTVNELEYGIYMVSQVPPGQLGPRSPGTSRPGG